MVFMLLKNESLYVTENVTYFDSCRIEHILKEIGKFIRNGNITTNIFIFIFILGLLILCLTVKLY